MPYITHCTTCQCPIIVKGNITASHATYIDCLEALIEELTGEFNRMLYTLKRIILVMKAEIKKRDDLQKELNKFFEMKE